MWLEENKLEAKFRLRDRDSKFSFAFDRLLFGAGVRRVRILLLAPDANAGLVLAPFASVPPVATLARVVVFVRRSRTNTSATAFASPATRFVATLSNATKWPSAVIEGFRLAALP